MNTFNAVFSDNPVRTPPPADVTDDKTEEVEAPEVEETEPEKPSDPAEPSSAPPPPPEVDKPTENAEARESKPATVPHERFHAERERRKQLEARLAELEKKPKTSVLEDEDKAFSERLSDAVAPVRSQFFELTVELAKEKPGREDYDEIYEFMNEECAKHPELMGQIVNSRNPGEVIYQLGKSRKELAEVGGDITKLKDKIRGELKSELEQAKEQNKLLQAELAALKESKEKRGKIPQSTNSEASGTVSAEAFAGPTPLKNLFKN